MRAITYKGHTVDPDQIVDDAMACLESGEGGLGICLHCNDISRHGGYVDCDTSGVTCDNCERPAVMACEEALITFEPFMT